MMVRVLLEPPALTFKRRGRQAANRVRWVFLAVGVVALGYTGYVYLDSRVYQAYADWSFDQQSAGKTPTVMGFLRDGAALRTALSGDLAGGSSEADSKLTESEEIATPAPASIQHVKRVHSPENAVEEPRTTWIPNGDESLIGRIAIPRLRVHAIVKEGVDDHTLRRAVGHVPGTAKPGEDGNIGLAGHRDSFFRRLQDVQKDDHILLETLDARYEYVVDSLKVVGPKDVSVLAPSKEPFLTLVTCYPFHYVGRAPRRYIVRARQIGVEAREGGVGVPARTGS